MNKRQNAGVINKPKINRHDPKLAEIGFLAVTRNYCGFLNMLALVSNHVHTVKNYQSEGFMPG